MKNHYLWPGFIVGLIVSATLGWLIGTAAAQLTEWGFYGAVVAAIAISLTIFYLISRLLYRHNKRKGEAASGMDKAQHKPA